MIRFALILAVATLMAACTPLQNPGVHRSAITGIDGAFSAQQVVSNHPHYVLVGRVMALRQGDEVALVADIGQLNNSGQYRLRMDTAWHNGMELPFRGARRLEDFCTAMGDCQGYRIGTLTFTPDSFIAAAAHGYRAHLIGPDAMVEIVLPAAMFQDVMSRTLDAGILR